MLNFQLKYLEGIALLDNLKNVVLKVLHQNEGVPLSSHQIFEIALQSPADAEIIYKLSHKLYQDFKGKYNGFTEVCSHIGAVGSLLARETSSVRHIKKVCPILHKKEDAFLYTAV